MIIQNLNKIIRAIDLLTSERGVTIKEMQEKLGLSRSSVYRLKDTLESLNFPLYDEIDRYDKAKKWYLAEDFIAKLPNINLPLIKLTLKDIVLINYLFSRASIFKDSYIQKELNILKEKLLKDSYLEKQTDSLSEKLEKLFFHKVKFSKDYSQKEEIIDLLITSMISQKQCFIKYHSPNREKTSGFVIEPLSMFEYAGGLYIFANIPYYNNIRMLAVERIQYIKQKENSFEYPEDFNAESIINSSFGVIVDEPVSVKIWFHASQAPYIKERKWAEKQEITDNPDGSIVISFTASGVFEIKKWVLSFGKYAKLLAPKDLASEISKEIQAMAKLYAG